MEPTPDPSLSPDSLVEDLLRVYPWAQRALFRTYHIGGCSSCAFDPTETIAALAERNGIADPETLLTAVASGHAEDEALQIDPTEVQRRLQSGELIRLLDVRTKEEWEAVRLPEAVRMSQETMPEILSSWPKDGLMVIYDHQGRQSLDAAAYFRGQGFENVRCLRDGIDGWSQHVDPRIRRYRLETNP